MDTYLVESFPLRHSFFIEVSSESWAQVHDRQVGAWHLYNCLTAAALGRS